MSSDIDPAKLKVVDLRNELAARGLDQKGVKAVLVKRLKDYLDQESESKKNAATKSEETPRKSTRKSADERDEVKPAKSVVAPSTPEKGKPSQETFDKPQETPNTMVTASPKTASGSDSKSVSPNLSKIDKKKTSEDHPKTVAKPTENPKSEIVDKVSADKKSPEKPKNEVKSFENFGEEKVPTESKLEEKPVSEAKSSDKVNEVKTPEKFSSEVKAQEKSTNNDQPSEASKHDNDSEMDESTNIKLDNINEEQAKASPMEVQEESGKTKKSEVKTQHRGEKRKRSDDSPGRSPKRQKAPPEDEPDINFEKVQLSWYDSDLHLMINKSTFLSAKPLNDGAFGYAWAGARATHGVSSGKVYYEVKIVDKLKWEDFSMPTERSRMDSRGRRDDRRHSRKYDDKDGKKSDSEKSKDKMEKKQDVKKEESMEITENNTREERVNKDNETDNGSNDNESDEKMEIDSEQKSDEKNDDAQKKDVEKEILDEEKKSIEHIKDSEEDKHSEVKMNSDEKEKVDTDKEEKKDIEEGNDSEDKKQSDENKEKEKIEERPLPTHYIRIGWSTSNSSLQLGEDQNSYAFESSGNFVKNKEFIAYGVPFDNGAVIGAYLAITENSVSFQFSVNGELQPAVEISKSELPENVTLYPHILSRNYEFEVNFGERDEPWFAISSEVDGYNFISKIENKVPGPKRPESRSDCEVLLMCGLPASGKTHWVNEHVAANADKNYTILGNKSILDKMTVCGEPLKNKYKGRWGILIDRIQKCLNKLVSTAALRRRNYIIDQTNVYASAQSRKMRPFEGFKRKAVVVVVGDEEQTRRQALKEVPDSTILGMKAAMVLPVVGEWLEEVSYVGVEEKEAKEIVKKYNEAGRAAGFPADKHRDNRRNDQGRHFQKRSGYQQSYQSSNKRWYRPPRRDGGGGGSWKHDSRSRDWRGSNYDQRSRDYYNQGSYDRRRSNYGGRSSSSDWSNSGGGNWGNRSQNSGWNQQSYGRNYNQAWSGSGNQNWSKYNNSGSGGWQGYGGNWNNYGQQGSWNQK